MPTRKRTARRAARSMVPLRYFSPLLLAPIAVLACTARSDEEPGTATDPAQLAICVVVDLDGNMHNVCDGGGGLPGADAGDGNDAGRSDGGPRVDGGATQDAGGHDEPDAGEPPPGPDGGACLPNFPDVSTPSFSVSRSFKREYKCPNGRKAGLNFAFSASTGANASHTTCGASANVMGSFTFQPELCGRLSGGAEATVNGTLATCLTPDCSTGVPLCKGPQCTTRNLSMDAHAFLQASWGVGELIPQARPFCDNGVVSCTVTVRLDGDGHASYDNANGQGNCGCCPSGNERDILAANGKLTGTVTGEINVDVGWLGRANLTVQGQACVGGWIRKGQSCDGPVDEAGGGWQVSASASGNACLGSGWFEYCRSFSAGPWTVGPGCDAAGGE